MKKIIHLLGIMLLSCSFSYAQSLSQVVVASSGATITGASNTLSFTAGEAIIGPIVNGVTVDQGFWTGAAKQVVLSNRDFPFEIQITAYPNPVTDYLNLSATEMAGKDLDVAMYDLQGRQLFRKELPESKEKEVLDLRTISPGIYMISVVESTTNQSTSFKIIKQ